MKTILVTGAAGFIGFHLCQRLLHRGDQVIGLDNLNDYYEVSLKQDRLAQLQQSPNFSFHKLDLANREAIAQLFRDPHFDTVVHLAAQVGVRYSVINPQAYVDSNLVGFANIIEGCRQAEIKHLIFASSSSVYGANTKIPFSVHDNVDHPLSLYAASKKANELMAHTYSHLYRLPTTGLRFFTVYGPWGRPDMALFMFTKAILEGQPINVFNQGKMKRDFTYVDDIVEGIIRVLERIPEPSSYIEPGKALDPSTSTAPYKLYNLGNNQPIELSYFIEVLEETLGIKAKKNMLPMQPGDVPITYADIDSLFRDTGFQPNTPIEVGIKHFIDWYKVYYNRRY
jgi:UDP-glucuronate 4-epimerase